MENNGHNARCGALLTTLILFGAIVAFGQRALIEGKVTLPKPQVSVAPPPRYAGQIGEIAPADPPEAVVYLEGSFPASDTNFSPSANQVRQNGMQFRPALLPIRVGTKVSFPNEDDFYHNVFSYSKSKRFDLGRYRREDKPATQLFDKPGVVKMYCDIHQHMRGIILVLDTPYFTRTTNGVYRLQDLPAGHYLLKAWVNETHVYERPVELKPAEQLHVDFDAK